MRVKGNGVPKYILEKQPRPGDRETRHVFSEVRTHGAER